MTTGLLFDADVHRYTLDGEVLPSVTGVLKASGLIDFSGIPEPIIEQAQYRGRVVHQAVHFWNEHDLDVAEFEKTFPSWAGYLHSWIALYQSGTLRTVCCEHRVASRRRRYAGTIDWLGEYNGKGAILDYATGDPEDVAKHLQTAGYDGAAREWSHEPGEERLRAFYAKHQFIERYSVRLKKSGAMPVVTPYPDPRHLSEFYALIEARRIVELYRGEARAWLTEAA